MLKKYFFSMVSVVLVVFLANISVCNVSHGNNLEIKKTRASFHLPESGCPMAHCDCQMTDNANAVVPTSQDTSILWHDTIPSGSGIGLGCSSNGHLAACTYMNPTGDNLVIYNSAGERLWTSGNLLSRFAWTSAPMVDKNGGVIAVDESNLIRFDRKGKIIWKTAIAGGLPISPVITESGIIVLATRGGPISAYRSTDGSLIGELWIRVGSTYFHTINTPCVRKNRVYISVQAINDTSDKPAALLVAIDIDPENNNEQICQKWTFPFIGPSGASPVCINDVIYFDGQKYIQNNLRPYIFAVKDEGDTPPTTTLWERDAITPVLASLSKDPRGGLWYFPSWTKNLIRLDEDNGDKIETIDLSTLVNEGYYLPSSVMIQAGTLDQPVMIVGAATVCYNPEAEPCNGYVVAIDLNNNNVLWKVPLKDELGNWDWTASQYAIIFKGTNKPVIVCPGEKSGAYGIGEARE